ncbi:hypothetical protein Gotur_023272 [Gossypium turneri]
MSGAAVKEEKKDRVLRNLDVRRNSQSIKRDANAKLKIDRLPRAFSVNRLAYSDKVGCMQYLDVAASEANYRPHIRTSALLCLVLLLEDQLV